MIAGGLVTLGVKDVGIAERFYIETLGMKLVGHDQARSVIDAGDGFLFELKAGAPHQAITFFPKVPLAQAKSIYEMRGVVFSPEGEFQDPDGNKLRLCERPV